MKFLLLVLLQFYSMCISPLLKSILGVEAMCRYTPSCSEYASRQIKKYGVIRGVYHSIIRILSCQPFVKLPFHSV